MTRVLVADDHSLFRDGIVSLLQAAGFEVVGQAGDGPTAITAVTELHPDLVLLDIDMPGMSGLTALQHIKDKVPDTKVVMLTVSDSDKDLLDAIQSGASGYLLKDLDAGEFVELLDGLQRGEAPMTRKTASRLLEKLSTESREKQGDRFALSDREIEVLKLVARGLANKAIATQLSISENTVKYHLKNILQKLNVRNRTEAVSQAFRTGLVEPPAEAETPSGSA